MTHPSARRGLLEGKVTFIAGVGEGLGGDAARLFAAEGAKVVMMARGAGYIAALAEDIARDGGEALALTGDLLDEASCASVCEQALARFGQLDVVINVAARGDRPHRVALMDMTDDFAFWRESYEMNAIAPMRLARIVAPHMIARRSGRIVFVNSMTGDQVRLSSYAYSGSKAALHKMTQCLALELAPHGIRVNGLFPGYMWGPVVQDSMERESAQAGITHDEWLAQVTRDIPLGYIPPTSEYAGALLFLASDLAAPMTGSSLHVNGGQLLR